ncbi:Permease of the major facilitator superfamily [Leuconostoc gelidum subsp. gasicomitatum]|nr:Permease of the major facilitator superfamily [Leuconostoc gasicomitatum]
MKNMSNLSIKNLKLNLIWPYLVIIVIAFVYALPQLNVRGIYVGADSSFHFNRAFEAMSRLKYLNFHNSQISLYGFNASGRIINALYGPGLGYFFGVVLLLTKSWLKFQLVTNFILTVGTISLSYWLFNKYSRQKFLSLVFAVILSLTSYWSIGYWYQSAGGMTWGMMFMPLVIDSGIRMHINQQRPVGSIRLGFIMALILETHMLSFLFSFIVLAAFFITGLLVNKNRWLLIKQTTIAGLIGLGLTLGYWADYFSIMRTQSILSPFVDLHPANVVVHLSQGLSLWLLVLAIVLIVALRGRLAIFEWVLFICGITFLIVASGPNILLNHWNDIIVFRIIQFPMRFALPGCYLVSLLVILLLSQMIKQLPLKRSYVFAIGLGLLLIASTTIKQQFLSNMTVNQRFWQNSDFVASRFYGPRRDVDTKLTVQKDLQSRNSGFEKTIRAINFWLPDYLPGKGLVYYNDDNEKAVQAELISPNVFKKHISKKGDLVVTWNQSKAYTTKVPIIVYKQSKLVINGHNVKPQTTINGVLKVSGNQGKNIVVLGIKMPIIVKIAKLTPVIILIVISIMVAVNKKNTDLDVIETFLN